MNDFEKIGEYELNLEKLAKSGLKGTVILSILALALHYIINPLPSFSFSSFFLGMLLVAIYYVGLICLHELCHLIGFVVFCGTKLSSLKVGLNLKAGVAYATTTELMRNKDARKALLLPFWLTGVLPLVAGIYYDHFALTIVSAWLIVGALGDFSMYFKLKKMPKEIYVLDDSEKPKLHFYKKTERVS